MNRGELINPAWVGDPSVTGGFLYETTIHMFDMMRFLLGEVSELIALGSTHEYPETDDFSVLMNFASGMHATLASSADASWLFPFERVEVFCHHATIVTREMESLVYSEGLDGRHVERVRGPRRAIEQAVARELKNALRRCMASGLLLGGSRDSAPSIGP